MTYMINARLEQGTPSLTLIDAKTGEERLYWHAGATTNSRHDLHQLFKQLMLLSCADRFHLIQRAQSPAFGEECLDCFNCKEQHQMVGTQTQFSLSTQNSFTNGEGKIVPITPRIENI